MGQEDLCDVIGEIGHIKNSLQIVHSSELIIGVKKIMDVVVIIALGAMSF